MFKHKTNTICSVLLGCHAKQNLTKIAKLSRHKIIILVPNKQPVASETSVPKVASFFPLTQKIEPLPFSRK